MTLKPRKIDRRYFVAGGLALATAVLASRAGAGRTYKSQNEDDNPGVELCRLRRREYVDGGTNCVYKRQSGGKDDDPGR